MNRGIDINMKIAECWCLNPNGCPKLKGITEYQEKVNKCGGCTDVLNKIDLVELLNHLYNSTECTPTTTDTKPPLPTHGKGTELSRSDIKKILTFYHIDLIPITRIAKENGFSYRTVKNVVNQTFKNETSNEKVKKIKDEMDLAE